MDGLRPSRVRHGDHRPPTARSASHTHSLWISTRRPPPPSARARRAPRPPPRAAGAPARSARAQRPDDSRTSTWRHHAIAQRRRVSGHRAIRPRLENAGELEAAPPRARDLDLTGGSRITWERLRRALSVIPSVRRGSASRGSAHRERDIQRCRRGGRVGDRGEFRGVVSRLGVLGGAELAESPQRTADAHAAQGPPAVAARRRRRRASSSDRRICFPARRGRCALSGRAASARRQRRPPRGRSRHLDPRASASGNPQETDHSPCQAGVNSNLVGACVSARKLLLCQLCWHAVPGPQGARRSARRCDKMSKTPPLWTN